MRRKRGEQGADSAVLVQARKRIASATETWSALAGGDTNRLKAVTDQAGFVQRCSDYRSIPDALEG